MNHSVRSCVLLASIAGIAGAMLAQSSSTHSNPTRDPCMEVIGDTQSSYTVGKPFVATWTETKIHKRDDGTDLAPVVSLIKIARDSSGKVYTEYVYQENQDPSRNGIPHRSFSVDDPVTGTTYMWSDGVRAKVVTVFHSPGINSREVQERLQKSPWAKRSWAVPLCVTYGPDSSFDSDEFSIRNIGTSRILGTDAQGILATRNNDPVSEERWYSADLQIALTTRVNDSRFGTSVREVKSLEQIEPDQSLFRIPAGYAIEDVNLPHGDKR
jgi:hypothetical protein